MLSRILKFILGILTLLLVAIAAGLIWLDLVDWNRFRPYVAEQSEKILGRTVQIHGDLNFDLGWSPRLSAANVTVENSPWAGAEPMVDAGSASLELSLWSLLFGPLRLDEIRLHDTTVNLARNAKGDANWTFEGMKEPKEKEPRPQTLQPAPPELPIINLLDVENVTLRYVDPTSLKEPVDVRIRTLTGKSEAAGRLPIQGQGSLEGQLWDLETTIATGGEGASLRDIRFTFGKSTLVADVAYRGTNPPHLDLDATIPQLYRPDLQPVLALTKPAPPEEPQPDKEPTKDRYLIPATPLPSSPFGFLTAEVDILLENYRGSAPLDVPLEGAELKAQLDTSRLLVPKLRVDSGLGTLWANAGLSHVRSNRYRTDLSLRIEGLALTELVERYLAPALPDLERLKARKLLSGTAASVLEVRSEGNTPRQMASNLNGDFSLAVDNGEIGGIIMEVLALDLGESLVSWFTDNPVTPFRCYLSHYNITSGVVETRASLLATRDANLVTEGVINLDREDLDLTVKLFDKDFSLTDFFKEPISISGDLDSPQVALDMETPLSETGTAQDLLQVIRQPSSNLMSLIEDGFQGNGRQCLPYVQELAQGAESPRRAE